MRELADAVVVGGGILGVNVAYELAWRSLSVVLLEAGDLGAGASTNSFAWINGTAKHTDDTYHRLNARGLERYRELARTWRPELMGLHGGGALFWAGPGTAETHDLRRRAERLQEWRYPITRLKPGEAHTLEPEMVVEAASGEEGLFAPADMWLDVDRFLSFLAARGREQRVDIEEHCPALGFTRDRTGAVSTVETPKGRIATARVVLCAGIHTPELTAMVGGADAARYAPLDRIPGLLIETAVSREPDLLGRVCFPPDSGGLHMRPTPNGGVRLGADDIDALWSPGRCDGDAPDLDAAASELMRRARRFLPTLEGGASFTARLGVRPVPADGYPIAGPLPDVPGAFVMVTHSGITLGPLLARLLAEEIVGGSAPSLLHPYRPERFA